MWSGRRQKGIYSKFHPPPILFCFCISFFDDYRRDCFCFWRSRDETVFVSRNKERGGWGGGAAPPLLIVEGGEGEKREGTLF